MLYNLDWLSPGKPFPPVVEEPRITRYRQNAQLFDGEHFADPVFRSRNPVTANGINSHSFPKEGCLFE